MARMHSRRRGSSGSSKPANPNTDWVIYDDGDVRDLVQKLHGQGLAPSAIGRVLRDQYGVPSVHEVTGDTITDIVEEDSEFPEDIRNLMRQALSIRNHLDENPNDLAAKRNLGLTEAKIRRLADHYRGDRIPGDWTYNIEKARLIVE